MKCVHYLWLSSFRIWILLPGWVILILFFLILYDPLDVNPFLLILNDPWMLLSTLGSVFLVSRLSSAFFLWLLCSIYVRTAKFTWFYVIFLYIFNLLGNSNVLPIIENFLASYSAGLQNDFVMHNSLKF